MTLPGFMGQSRAPTLCRGSCLPSGAPLATPHSATKRIAEQVCGRPCPCPRCKGLQRAGLRNELPPQKEALRSTFGEDGAGRCQVESPGLNQGEAAPQGPLHREDGPGQQRAPHFCFTKAVQADSGGFWRRLLNQRVGLAAGEFDTGCKNMKPGPFIINAEILEEILLCLLWTELTPHSYAEALPPMWCFEVGPLGGNQVWGTLEVVPSW